MVNKQCGTFFSSQFKWVVFFTENVFKNTPLLENLEFQGLKNQGFAMWRAGVEHIFREAVSFVCCGSIRDFEEVEFSENF